MGRGNAWGVRRTCNAKYRRVQIPHDPPSVPSQTAIAVGNRTVHDVGADRLLEHLGKIFGDVEESGRPRHPVTVDITGSNPVITANFDVSRVPKW